MNSIKITPRAWRWDKHELGNQYNEMRYGAIQRLLGRWLDSDPDDLYSVMVVNSNQFIYE